FLEESHVSAAQPGPGFQIMALFRYDLDPAEIKGESTLVLVQVASADHDRVRVRYEYAADRLASLLGEGKILDRQFVFPSQKASDVAT
ncbi:MAG TPA: hypothetical protein VH744_04690, partial [Terriglobales bacterium]